MKTYKDLDVYQRSYRLAIEIYKDSFNIPQKLQYDIADDLRRATRSIPSNICEGYGRNKSKRDLISFLKIALGSCDEVLFNIEFLKDLKLLKGNKYKYFIDEYQIVSKQLNKLTTYLKTKPPDN